MHETFFSWQMAMTGVSYAWNYSMPGECPHCAFNQWSTPFRPLVCFIGSTAAATKPVEVNISTDSGKDIVSLHVSDRVSLPSAPGQWLLLQHVAIPQFQTSPGLPRPSRRGATTLCYPTKRIHLPLVRMNLHASRRRHVGCLFIPLLHTMAGENYFTRLTSSIGSALQLLRITSPTSKATNLSLCLTKYTLQAQGKAMGYLVVLECHLWLNLAHLPDYAKVLLLEAPVIAKGCIHTAA